MRNRAFLLVALLFTIVLVLAGTGAGLAQDSAACTIDLNSVIGMLATAQAQATTGDTDAALQAVSEARAKLQQIEVDCGVADAVSPSTTIDSTTTTAPSPVPGGKIAIRFMASYYTKLNGLAFVNNVDLVFVEQTSGIPQALNDPEISVFIEPDVCGLIRMDPADVKEFLSKGKHLWVFYDPGIPNCNDELQQNLNIVAVSDYDWTGKSRELDISPAVFPWLQDLKFGSANFPLHTYLMSRGGGFQGFMPNAANDAQRLVVTSFEHNGGTVTFFPSISAPYENYYPFFIDELIERDDNEEAAVRVLKFLSGQDVP